MVIDMKITIYHGSNYIIDKPIYGYGKSYNDYGLGFYCTKSIDLAKEWSTSLNIDGYANKYEIDTTNLTILNLNDGNYTILNWLAILLKNREFDTITPIAIEARNYLLNNFLINYEAYDIIIGYRADDSYFSFANDFLNNSISLKQLNKAMHLGKLGEQFVLKSKKAFDNLKFISSEKVSSSIWYPLKSNRSTKARIDYFKLREQSNFEDDIYILDILRKGMKNNDPRLR